MEKDHAIVEPSSLCLETESTVSFQPNNVKHGGGGLSDLFKAAISKGTQVRTGLFHL